MDDTLVATPWIQTRVWRDTELRVRGVLGAEEIGPIMETLILISTIVERKLWDNGDK